MKIFILDLWHDLREKRLWPVALVLLLGLVAVPVLLAKPFEDPGPPPAATTAPPTEEDEDDGELAQVTLGDTQGAGSGSTLGVFDPSDPFRPPAKLTKKDKDEAAAAQGDITAPVPTGGGTTDTPSSGGGTTDPGSGGTGGTGGGTTTTITTYKYVVDVTFTANGRTRRIKGLEKLDMLPNEASPLLIFMGVTTEGSNAVFLVDSTLKAAGEGKCKPSASDCAFVYVGAGSEHVFTKADGDSYTMRVDEIRKVKVELNGTAAKSGKAGKTSKVSANAAVGGAPRRFVPPVVADLVVVATDQLENSDNDSDRR